jgi:hypothetical protein
VVNLHWHAFVEIPANPQGEPLRYQSVPSSALQVNIRWDAFADLETDVLETSWELGAWDLRRIGTPACGAPDVSAQRYAECLTSFGVSAQEINGDQVFVADVPDGAALVDAAARAGYVRWQFRPMWCGLMEGPCGRCHARGRRLPESPAAPSWRGRTNPATRRPWFSARQAKALTALSRSLVRRFGVVSERRECTVRASIVSLPRGCEDQAPQKFETLQPLGKQSQPPVNARRVDLRLCSFAAE